MLTLLQQVIGPTAGGAIGIGGILYAHRAHKRMDYMRGQWIDAFRAMREGLDAAPSASPAPRTELISIRSGESHASVGCRSRAYK